MDRAPALMALLTLAAVWAAPARAEPQPSEARSIDISGDLAADVARSAARDSRLGDDLWLCAGEAPSRALLGKFRIGAIILTRDHAKAEPSAKVFRTADDSVLLDATGIGLGTEPGLDLTFLMVLNESLEIEARYFGVLGWSTSATLGDPGGVRFEGFGESVTGQSERVDYASRLYSIEINLRPRVSEGIPLILGFRTFQLHERFEAWIVDPQPASAAISTRTNNYLYGFQIGAEPYFAGADGPLQLDGLLKAGIYGVHATQHASSPLAESSLAARKDRASFGGEAGLAVAYRISRFFTVRAGYEALWLTAIALAPDQSRTTDLAAGTAAVSSSGSTFLHGATAALEFVF